MQYRLPDNFYKNVIFALLVLIFTSGCARHKGLTKVKPEPERSAYNWYNDAMQELVSHDYDKAVHSFTLLIEQHTGTIYARKALLRIGDTYFKQEEYRSAKTAFREFLKRYPGSSLSGHAKFMIGYSDFRMRYNYKHSQENAKAAANELIGFITDYPQSSYKLKAENMFSVLISQLEKHELYVTKFYLSIDKPTAAMIRLNYLDNRYDVDNLKNITRYYRIQALIKLKRYRQARSLLNMFPKNNIYYKRLRAVKRLNAKRF